MHYAQPWWPLELASLVRGAACWQVPAPATVPCCLLVILGCATTAALHGVDGSMCVCHVQLAVRRRYRGGRPRRQAGHNNGWEGAWTTRSTCSSAPTISRLQVRFLKVYCELWHGGMCGGQQRDRCGRCGGCVGARHSLCFPAAWNQERAAPARCIYHDGRSCKVDNRMMYKQLTQQGLLYGIGVLLCCLGRLDVIDCSDELMMQGATPCRAWPLWNALPHTEHSTPARTSTQQGTRHGRCSAGAGAGCWGRGRLCTALTRQGRDQASLLPPTGVHPVWLCTAPSLLDSTQPPALYIYI